MLRGFVFFLTQLLILAEKCHFCLSAHCQHPQNRKMADDFQNKHPKYNNSYVCF